jgi:thymidylate synthase
MISDAHIYDRHEPIVRELIERPQYPAPKFRMNPDVKNFYDFTLDDFAFEDYQAGPQVKKIPVAV